MLTLLTYLRLAHFFTFGIGLCLRQSGQVTLSQRYVSCCARRHGPQTAMPVPHAHADMQITRLLTPAPIAARLRPIPILQTSDSAT